MIFYNIFFLQTKDLLSRLLKFFEMETRNGRCWDLAHPVKRLAKATGNYFKQLEENQNFF